MADPVPCTSRSKTVRVTRMVRGKRWTTEPYQKRLTVMERGILPMLDDGTRLEAVVLLVRVWTVRCAALGWEGFSC